MAGPVTPEQALADAMARLNEKDAQIEAVKADRDHVQLESDAKEDARALVATAQRQAETFRLALAEANRKIDKLMDELVWRREAMGEEPNDERPPQPAPPPGPMPELPEDVRRERPEDILPGRRVR
jgi:phytoene dehydrogenase-like protein